MWTAWMLGPLYINPGLGLHAAVVGAFGNWGAVLIGASTGALLGCLLALGTVWVYRKCCDDAGEEELLDSQRREVVQHLMKHLDSSPLTDELLAEALQLFETLFVRVMDHAVTGDQCPICLEPFPAGGCTGDEQPCSSRNCQGHQHLCHRACLIEYQRRSGDFTCVICRQ
mmetsp:Transcript_34842/g.63650  ORF Transcript_34842/g.63650 Transcript_34842/m.63650 type:complete len:170 (+) Transcript_34842:160-669(+)